MNASLYERNPLRIPVPCLSCGVPVTPRSSWEPRKFCDKRCAAAYRKLHPLPVAKPRRHTSGKRAPAYALGDSTEGHTRQNVANNRGSIFPKRYGR